MNRALRKKIEALIEEEQQKPVDEDLLNELRKLAAGGTDYGEGLSPERRNALNTFFKEVKDLMIHELLDGDYGADIIIDSIIVLCFEVGTKIAPKLTEKD